jgi:hypothetical protein
MVQPKGPGVTLAWFTIKTFVVLNNRFNTLRNFPVHDTLGKLIDVSNCVIIGDPSRVSRII